SSREHAPWALAGWGFRAVISTSFADIFRGNALKNGLLPVVVERRVHEALFAARSKGPAMTLTIDLAREALLLPDAAAVALPIDAFSKRCLYQALDELAYLLSFKASIEAYEAART